jgi:hypothetical protein
MKLYHAVMLFAVLFAVLVITQVHAAPTYVISADKAELRQGDTVTMTHTITPGAADAPQAWTLTIPVMPGLTLISATGNKGSITNQGTLTSTDQANVVSNKVTLYVALAVPNPTGGVLTCPLGVLQGGGNAATVVLVWRY